MDLPNYDLFYLGDLKLRSGVTLPGAKLVYKTFGSLSPTKDNVIVFPCAYNGFAGANSVDTKFVNDRIAELLAS